MLPIEFQLRMKEMLQDEYEEFQKCFEEEKHQGLRLNPLKVDRDVFLSKTEFNLKKIPWASYGFYYEDADTPGKHPFHEAGAYYIQEPSAMAPVEYLGVRPGDKILDLCAAPGGKSTQIAGYMQGQGILFCNEIHPARAKILSENVERMGIKNALVTNESPERLTKVFKEYFDRILVDAPCSGEGMFRKNDAACSEWSVENVNLCGSRQDGILDCAAGMLSPGGRIVYSTCTFAPVENEGSISRFIQRHPEFHIVSVEKKPGMSEGVSKWWDNPCENLEDTIRLWPHKLHGEGHYLAVLEKDRLTEEHSGRMATERGISKKECKEYFDFCHDYLIKEPQGNLIRFGDQLYLVPEDTPSLKGLKVLRPGLHLGTLKKNRFEPSHALALALTSNQVKYSCNLSLEKDEIYGYLNGETFSWEGEKGWYLVNIENLSTGWGKLTGNTMKNHYPKGLRKKLNRKKA